jgi:hypothetical protein
MRTIKTFFTLFLGLQLLIGQNIEIEPDSHTPGSDNYTERNRAMLKSESLVNIYSNIAVADVYVWNLPWASSERIFPAQIALPTDNQRYVISLYSQAEYQAITIELQNFDFDYRDVEEFELLQDELSRMELATKLVRPIPGTDSSVFLTHCSSDDLDCEKGMNWLDQFYAKFYDSKQEQNLASDLNGEDLTEDEKSLVRRHRMGVFGMIGLFSMAVFMIDSNIQ